MEWSDDRGIGRLEPADIDSGLIDAAGDLSLDISNKADQKRRAESFGRWLEEAVPKVLKEYVCFVDYAVFQDAKIQNPYFYIVSPREETTEQYTLAVKKLVEGTEKNRDCFSVAYHPEFVGIRPNARNSFRIITVGEPLGAPTVLSELRRPVLGTGWVADLYLLWKADTSWQPPTSREALNQICGQHSLEECLVKFQGILQQVRQEISDSIGRPLTFVYCIPFLVPNTSLSNSASGPPFSEIAAALFLGVSFKGTDEQTEAVMGFLRTLALWTYRIAGIKKAEQAGEATGQAQGLEQGLRKAIESFAHQIKGVANAMSTSWFVTPEKWEEIRQVYLEDPTDYDAAARIKAARVLPVPQFFEAIRDTLVLWSQTRRLHDLYPEWPSTFEDVIRRAWRLTSSARFTLGNKNRDFEADFGELKKVWDQEYLTVPLEVNGHAPSLGDGRTTDLQAESWICNVTRLLAAIFDNSLEHGIPNTIPQILFDWDVTKQIVSLTISNQVDRVITNPNSRLRIGMKGNEVLQFLADELNADLTLPRPRPEPGDVYIVTVAIPLPSVFIT